MLFCALTLWACQIAAAPAEPFSVAERQMLNRSAHGWTGANINWLPKLDLGYGYTDNVRASPFNTVSDHITTVAPSLSFNTLERETGVTGLLQVRQLTFAKHSSQNQTNGTVRLSPYYYIGSQWRGTSTVALIADHELPSSESTLPLADEPTPYQQIALASNLIRDVGHLAVEFFASYDLTRFGNTHLINGARVINDDRNRNDLAAGFEVAAQSTGKRSKLGWRNAIVQQNFTRSDFNIVSGQYDGFNRDSAGWRSQAVIKAQPLPLIRVDGRAGLEHRSFSQGQWDDRNVIVADIQAVYLLNALTNLTVDIERSVQTTAFEAAPAFTQQAVQVGIDHELRRNIVLTFSVQRSTADYWDSARDDTSWRSRVGVSYQQNRFVAWQASVQHQQRDSTINLADFDENRFTLGTRIEF